MEFTLHQLRIFLQVVDSGSITKASEELFLTQPAVSIQLKKLQEQFDVPLTEVVGRRLFITDFGLELAKNTREILGKVDEMKERQLAFRGELGGKMKISVVSTGKYVLPYFLSEFTQQYPGVELSIDVTNKRQVLESLENNLVDFSLVSVVPPSLMLESMELLPNELFMVGSGQGTWSADKWNRKDIANLPFIYREEGSATRQAMEQFFTSEKWPVRRKLELTSNEAVKQAVIAGLGYSIMPVIGMRNELESGQLKIIQLRGLPIVTTWRLVWMKGKNHGPAVTTFLNHVRERRAEILKQHF